MYNLQGDVIALVDANGTKVVEYRYDAWGKPISKTGTLAATLGTLNPFRYRGYVYDEETGLYYLRSRYYNPTWGRFVNCDAQCGTLGEPFTHNVFAYCVNSPVGLIDQDGRVWIQGAYAPNYGFYHILVQQWLVAHNPGLEMEVKTSTGRIDLYNRQTCEIYEVKPDNTAAIAQGREQLRRYARGDLPVAPYSRNLILPPDGAITREYPNTVVTVRVRQQGQLITYKLEVKRKKKVPEPAYAVDPVEQKERSVSYNPAPASSPNPLGFILSFALVIAAIASPVPGDEWLALTLLVP